MKTPNFLKNILNGFLGLTEKLGLKRKKKSDHVVKDYKFSLSKPVQQPRRRTASPRAEEKEKTRRKMAAASNRINRDRIPHWKH